MKNAATPPRTITTTKSKVKMPAFIPLANRESLLPKQAAQADALGAKIALNTAAIRMVKNRFTGS